MIYGDYDVDGLTSTAILYNGLKNRGLQPGFFIPSRYLEGYGLNAGRVRQFKEKGYSLIVTVDNGISALEEIKLADQLGMEVVVIDHHEWKEVLPETSYIFHHKLSGFLDYNCSAASLAYFVAARLMRKDDAYLGALAGIAVFSDVMPLVGNNLEFAKISLRAIERYRYDNLCSLMGGDLSYRSIGLNLNPALNAPGRVAKDSLSTNNACRFLLEPTSEKTTRYSSFLLQLNEKKKEIIKSFSFDEKKTFDSESAFVAMTEDFSGLTGLFANSILRQKAKPVLIFAPSDFDRDQLIGSMRLPEGYTTEPLLAKKYLVQSGGHKRAAGVTIFAKDYLKFAVDFTSEMAKQALEHKGERDSDESIFISLEDLTLENLKTYSDFEPFGEGFAEPTFKLYFSKEDVIFSKNGKCAFLYTKDKTGKASVFSGVEALTDPQVDEFVLEGTMRREVFQNKESCCIIADKILKV